MKDIQGDPINCSWVLLLIAVIPCDNNRKAGDVRSSGALEMNVSIPPPVFDSAAEASFPRETTLPIH